MSIDRDMQRFIRQVEADTKAILVNVASHAYESIVNGSVITGAPGQPVDTGNLRNSWQLTFPTPTSAEITTNVDYAIYVEDNVRGVTFKNHGPHSVKLTTLAFPKIVAHEAALMRGAR